MSLILFVVGMGVGAGIIQWYYQSDDYLRKCHREVEKRYKRSCELNDIVPAEMQVLPIGRFVSMTDDDVGFVVLPPKTEEENR